VRKIIKFPFKKKNIQSQMNYPKTDSRGLDERFRKISQQSHNHLQKGELGLYACDLYSLSEINRKEKMYEKQLHSLVLSAYIHLFVWREYA
jgi:hypothetical protein